MCPWWRRAGPSLPLSASAAGAGAGQTRSEEHQASVRQRHELWAEYWHHRTSITTMDIFQIKMWANIQVTEIIQFKWTVSERIIVDPDMIREKNSAQVTTAIVTSSAVSMSNLTAPATPQHHSNSVCTLTNNTHDVRDFWALDVTVHVKGHTYSWFVSTGSTFLILQYLCHCHFWTS